MRPIVLAALAAAVLAPAAGAQTVVQVINGTPKGVPKVPCPDTILVSAALPGATARFVLRGAVDGVVLIAPGVRTVRRDAGGVELVATTPAQLVVPQRAVQLVLAPLDAANGIQIDRTGRDQAGRAIYLHAQGTQVALTRDGGTGLRVVADHVTLREQP
jgi:hypothetical protein